MVGTTLPLLSSRVCEPLQLPSTANGDDQSNFGSSGKDMDTVAEVFEPPMQPDSGGDVNIGGSAGGDVHL